jgi:hypothetical protein
MFFWKNKRPKKPYRWIFSWHIFRDASHPKYLSLAITTALFALLLSTIRIKITSASHISPPHATLIYAPTGNDEQNLQIRALEGGPFPSRFYPSEWEGFASANQTVFAKPIHHIAPPAPALRPLGPEKPNKTSHLAGFTLSVFPDKPEPRSQIAPSPALAATPVIFFLSESNDQPPLPNVPALSQPISPEMSAEEWRFTLEINSQGRISECIALNSGDSPGLETITHWLRQITFPKPQTNKNQWIAVGVRFSNLPAPPQDGTFSP